MLPVLFSIGNMAISSFGVFLSLGFLYGVFLIWRLTRAWDLDEEKILDLTLLTFLGGFIFARLYFGFEHFLFFIKNPLRLILVQKYPGFSFWGGFIGGWLTLYFFARRKKVDFWQIADIAAVGFLGGLIFSSIGCFLGGCSIGTASNLPLAVPMVGAIGKRFPIQVLEAAAYLFVLGNIWKQATHFHQRGKIISSSLIYIGMIKLITEPLRQVHGTSYIFAIVLIVLGVTVFYKVQQGKRTPVSDLRWLILFIVRLITDRDTQRLVVSMLRKNWYNQKTYLLWQLKNFSKILRRFRVKLTPKNIG